MKFAFEIITLSLIVAGCGRQDARLHQQLLGSWKTQSGPGSLNFLPDGSFRFANEYVSSNGTLKWSSAGTWDVRGAYLIITITNSTAENTSEKPTVGEIDRFKINFLDEHNLAYGDEERGGSYHR